MVTYPPIEKPTEPGWYWWRHLGGGWVMIEVFVRFDERFWIQPPAPLGPQRLSDELGGEWRGPIPEPTS